MILITDRRDLSQSLYEVVASIEPCTRLRPGGYPSRCEDHAIFVCDIALDRPASLVAARATLDRCRLGSAVPILCLSRQDSEGVPSAAAEIGATAVLPSRATRAQILFTIRRLIEASLLGSATPLSIPGPFTAARIREAGAAFAEVIDASQHGRPLPMDVLERGGNAIIAAVSGSRIAPWLDAVHAYDDLTYQHCLLVAGLATAFAKHLGVSLAGQRLIAQAGLIHDIGKVMIPAHILNKPARLTDDEMDIIRRHPTIGHEMLVKQGGFDPRKLDIVRHHHEYVDGSGYPDRLKGDEISPLVRLTTICDIYAALIERRPYRAPMSLVEALDIIRSMSGKLDSPLVEAFTGLVNRSSA